MQSSIADADIHPEALRELAEAVVWYEDQYPGRGQRFYDAITKEFARIRVAPSSFPRWRRRLPARSTVVPRFPYTIFFVTEPKVVIMAVAHDKRRPGYWIRRLTRGLA